MQFLTLSEKEIASNYLTIREPHLLISVTNPGDDVAIPTTPYCKGLLKIKFHDVEDIDIDHTFFDNNLANKILEFVDESIDKVSLIVVHCGAGISRSVAIASALSKILNHKDDEIFSKGTPNMLVYLVLLEQYFTQKNLKSKWAKIYYVRNESLKQLLNPVIYRILNYRIEKREKDN